VTLHTRSVAELAAGLASREFSAVELAEHYLARVEAANPVLNAFVTVTRERALADARRADATRAAGNAGRLTGLPLAHKDIFCTDGIRTSCGSRMLDNFVAPYDDR
jgi:aspartyl-tRNA(Asn)/glutamyl-tRNA(Gln) amidotransferase subunit A